MPSFIKSPAANCASDPLPLPSAQPASSGESSLAAGASLACDLCGQARLEPVYVVPDSALGMIVYVCEGCGLVQSRPTRAPGERIVSTSSGARWGNVRHGKGLRLQAALPVLQEAIAWSQVRAVLDVGANRGDFVRWLHEAHPGMRVLGVEPDATIVDGYRDLPGLDLRIARIEDVALPEAAFDLAYCSHTLEHATSAVAMLRQIGDSLRPGGFLFLEVPNLIGIDSDEIVEEFFIDKHRFHFTRELLCDYATATGWRVLHGAADGDPINITLVLAKEEAGASRDADLRWRPGDISGATAAARHRQMIARYVEMLAANRARLRRVVERLRPFLARQRVAVWGAGRIFDALVVHGGLDVSQLCCVVDEYLWPYAPEVHGVRVQRPEQLKVVMPQVVLVLARSSAATIAARVRSLGIRNVILFRDLLKTV